MINDYVITTMMQKDDFFLVLDFGGSSVKGAVMSRDAQIHDRFSLPSKAASYEQWLDTLAPKFGELAERFALKGIAISTCGAVNVDSGVIEGASALPYIHDIDVRSLYQARFDLPVELENDGCCAALAEDWLGAGQDDDEFCLLVLGSGIGGAIVRDGEVIKVRICMPVSLATASFVLKMASLLLIQMLRQLARLSKTLRRRRTKKSKNLMVFKSFRSTSRVTVMWYLWLSIGIAILPPFSLMFSTLWIPNTFFSEGG